MDFLQLKICLLYLIVLIEGAVIKKRYKRFPIPPSPTTTTTTPVPSPPDLTLSYPTPTLPSLGLSLEKYTTILNQSVPINCPSHRRVLRRASLSTEGLHSLLKLKGGVFLPHLMAMEEQSANNFQNLLNLDTFSDEDEDIPDHVFTPIRAPAQKSQLEEDLRKWSLLTNFLQSANSSEKIQDNVKLKENSTLFRNTVHTISDFLVQNNLTLYQLIEYIKAMKISTHPKVLMTLEQHKHQRIKRDANDGSKTTIQYCKKKGSPEGGALFSLCQECGGTTTLPENTFPRYLNENMCGPDVTCLNVKRRNKSPLPHGKCVPVEMHLTLLRRRKNSNGCRMMIMDGQKFYVDEWETYTQKVRAGCRCAIDKRSYLFANLDLTSPVIG